METDTSDSLQRGLRSKEAEARLAQFGPNTIEEKQVSWAARLLKRFWGPIPWMIETAAVLSLSVQRWEEFAIIMVMLLVNAAVDFYQESKALNAIEVLKKKLARRALVLRDAAWQTIDASHLVPDDIIKIKIGDIVPADAKLLSGSDYIQVDQSALTGESLPVDKKVGDDLYANAIVRQGEMVAHVTGTGSHTYFGKTVGLVAKAEREGRSHFQKMVVRVGNFLILLTLAMIAVIIYHGVQNNEPTVELLIFALVLTISAIPVAMPAVLTVTMAIGAHVLALKEAIVSRLAAIEELAGMDVLCSDKTGTLTQNRMSLADPYVADGFDEEALYVYAALASKEENGDPIERPIFDMIDTRALRDRLKPWELKKFLPFDPVHKRTEGIYEDGECELIVTKGAPQIIIEQSDAHEFDRQKANEQVQLFADKGFRTLGVAFRKCEEDVYHFVGLLPFFDPPRSDSKLAVTEAEANGIDVKMVTGDNIAVATYIARLLSIGEQIEDVRALKGESIEEYLYLSKVLTSAITEAVMPHAAPAEVDAKVREILQKVQRELYNMPIPKGAVKKHESEIIALIEAAHGFAQVYPEDKYFIVDALQKADHIVGMTGDGVNDAPALKKADCGIAVDGATDAARAAADIVLTAPGLYVIVDAIKEARQIFERMKSYTIFRIAETIRVIIFMTLAIVLYDFYPVTALMIIILALLNDIPIMTIAYDNTKVRQRPVRWDMREVFVLASWLGIAGVLSSFTLFWVTMSLMHLPLDFVQSLFFVKLIVAGHGTIFNTRIDEWFFRRPFPSAPLLSASLLSAAAGIVVGVYGFGVMVPIGWSAAAAVGAYAFVWFIFNDVVKMAVLRYYRKRFGIAVI
ncbi:plasma-membrane proton-efflux P-type ATPase [Sulfurimonas sp. HSL1-2]|uniref:plasma-membrane proton-efflux P-type ATPase n=1 Tax=Thiomicrolovo zhangzhouensis TaxID=3131933 RepID=UPI0031F7DC76